MAVRLIKGLTEPRALALGEGVVLDVRPIGYAEMKSAEARAHRLAVDWLADLGHAADQSVLAGEDAASYRDRLTGLAEEIMLDALVEMCAIGWSGVTDEDGEAVTLTAETWAAFRVSYPFLADKASFGIRNPHLLIEQEGNVSAPSSDGR